MRPAYLIFTHSSIIGLLQRTPSRGTNRKSGRGKIQEGGSAGAERSRRPPGRFPGQRDSLYGDAGDTNYRRRATRSSAPSASSRVRPISYIQTCQHQQGREVHVQRLNLNVYIVNLWSIMVPKGTTMSTLSSAAAVLGRKGGKSKSPAKVRAVRENGKLGGRPPKKAAA